MKLEKIRLLMKKDLKYMTKDQTLIAYLFMAIFLSWMSTLLFTNQEEVMEASAFIDHLGIIFLISAVTPSMISVQVGQENWTKTARSLMSVGITPYEIFASKILSSYLYIVTVSLIILLFKGYGLISLLISLGLITVTYVPLCIVGLITGLLVKDLTHANVLNLVPIIWFFVIPSYSFMSDVKIISRAGLFTPIYSYIQLTNSLLNLQLLRELPVNGFLDSSLFSCLMIIIYTVGLGTLFILLYRNKCKQKTETFYLAPRR